MRVARYHQCDYEPLPDTPADEAAIVELQLDDIFECLPVLEALGLLRADKILDVYDITADVAGERFASIARRFAIVESTYDDSGGRAVPYITVRESDRRAIDRFVSKPLPCRVDTSTN